MHQVLRAFLAGGLAPLVSCVAAHAAPEPHEIVASRALEALRASYAQPVPYQVDVMSFSSADANVLEMVSQWRAGGRVIPTEVDASGVVRIALWKESYVSDGRGMFRSDRVNLTAIGPPEAAQSVEIWTPQTHTVVLSLLNPDSAIHSAFPLTDFRDHVNLMQASLTPHARFAAEADPIMLIRYVVGALEAAEDLRVVEKSDDKIRIGSYLHLLEAVIQMPQGHLLEVILDGPVTPLRLQLQGELQGARFPGPYPQAFLASARSSADGGWELVTITRYSNLRTRPAPPRDFFAWTSLARSARDPIGRPFKATTTEEALSEVLPEPTPAELAAAYRRPDSISPVPHVAPPDQTAALRGTLIAAGAAVVVLSLAWVLRRRLFHARGGTQPN